MDDRGRIASVRPRRKGDSIDVVVPCMFDYLYSLRSRAFGTLQGFEDIQKFVITAQIVSMSTFWGFVHSHFGDLRCGLSWESTRYFSAATR